MKRAILLVALAVSALAAPAAEYEVSRSRRDAETEYDRASFVSVLEELRAIAEGEQTPQDNLFFVIFSVFESSPGSDRPLVITQRVPIEIEFIPEPASRRSRSPYRYI